MLRETDVDQQLNITYAQGPWLTNEVYDLRVSASKFIGFPLFDKAGSEVLVHVKKHLHEIIRERKRMRNETIRHR